MNRAWTSMKAELVARLGRMRFSREQTVTPPCWLPSTTRCFLATSSLDAKVVGGGSNVRNWTGRVAKSSTVARAGNEICRCQVFARRRTRRSRSYRARLAETVRPRVEGADAQNPPDSKPDSRAQRQRTRLHHCRALRKAALQGEAAGASNENFGSRTSPKSPSPTTRQTGQASWLPSSCTKQARESPASADNQEP